MEEAEQPGVNFNDEIIRITNEVLSDGTIEQAMRSKIVAGFEEAMSSSFRYGELNRVIDRRVKEVLVPYIESYDMRNHITKLDEVLSQIVEQTALVDNKQLLENFRGLMIEPMEKTITLEHLFGDYCKHVAAHVDASDLDVCFDGGPSYGAVSASVMVEADEDRNKYSAFEFASIVFNVAESEDLSFVIHLLRWEQDKNPGFEISYKTSPDIRNLRYMSDFELLLIRLSRASVRLIWDECSLKERVTPDVEPSLLFRRDGE